MQNIINFIKYHNLFTIILGVVLLVTGGAFANEGVRNAVIGEEVVTTYGIDNSQLLAADLDNFDLNLQITNVREDNENYYLDYAYQVLAIKDNIWQPVANSNTLIVSKEALGNKDLGLYVQEELGEVVDYQLSYLKKVQEIEKQKGYTKLVASIAYTGLKGLIFNPKEKVLSGYEPVIQPAITSSQQVVGEFNPKAIEESLNQLSLGASDSVEQTTSIFTSTPETIIDSGPPSQTISVEATFEFHAEKDGVVAEDVFFRCKVNSWIGRTAVLPKTYPGLVPGDYTFQVFATDSQGKYDKTPAEFSWTITVLEESTPTTSEPEATSTSETATSTEPIVELDTSITIDEIATSTEPVCGDEHLDLCITQELCEGVSLHWYNDVCNLEPAPEPADTTVPVITLLGVATVDVDQGATYIDAGATAIDDVDGDITSNIVRDNPVDTETTGSYTVIYNVSDVAGNVAISLTRTVNVIEPASVPTP